MAHTCAVMACRNNRRNPDSVITMPHVDTLRWHVVREEDYEAVHELLSQPERPVTKWTNICSNHYRGGRPLDASRLPCLYMDGYPEWAFPLHRVNQELQDLGDNVLHRVLSFMCKYLNPLNATQILKTISLPATGNVADVGTLQNVALTLSVGLAQEMVKLVHRFISNGNKLEALAVHKYGAVLDGARIAVDVKHMLEGKKYGCMPTPKTMHNYATSSLSIPQKHIQMPNGQGLYPECTEKVRRSTPRQVRLKARRLHRKVTFLESQRAEHRLVVRKLRVVLKEAEVKVKAAMEEIKQPFMSVKRIKESDSLMEMHTGLPTYSLFRWVFAEVRDAAILSTRRLGKEPGEVEHKEVGKAATALLSTEFDTHGVDGRECDIDIAEADAVECELVEIERLERQWLQNEPKVTTAPRRCTTLSLDNQLLLTLVKLRLGLEDDYLAYQFGIPAASVPNIICIWLRLLSSQLDGLIHWPTAAEAGQLFALQLDSWCGVTAAFCTMKIRLAPRMQSGKFVVTSSNHVCKVLLACLPAGTVCFASRPAMGSLADADVARQCRFAEIFCPGDQCVAPHGFELQQELLECGVELLEPARLVQEKVTTRTHLLKLLEEVVDDVRRYKFLRGEIPLRYLNHLADAITVCCAMTNLRRAEPK